MTSLRSGKTPTFVSFYNSGVSLSLSISMLFLPVERWKVYRKVNKIYIILTVSPHYLTKSNTFWDDCGRPLPAVRSNRLFATFTESCLMFVYFNFLKNNFVKKIMSVFWQKIFYIFVGFDQDFIFKTQYIYLMLRSNSVNFCDVQCDAFMTSTMN